MEYVNMVHMDARGRRKEIVALVDHYGLLYYCRKGDLKEVREVLNVKIPNFDVNTPLRNRDAKLKVSIISPCKPPKPHLTHFSHVYIARCCCFVENLLLLR